MQVMEAHTEELDFTKPGVAQGIVDECYTRYFTSESLQRAADAKDWTLYNLQLRLRDISTLIEGDQGMRDGDIGRVLAMWKRWAVMAQGLKGLSHYAIHLPRYILILTKYLPESIAKAIRHSLLIPTGGREGHWVAKDFYLEIQNFWLKYFYNNSVRNNFLNTQAMIARINI